jgi:hypothetical protein
MTVELLTETKTHASITLFIQDHGYVNMTLSRMNHYTDHDHAMTLAE